MASLRLVLGDQLSHSLSALEGAGKSDVILMMEVVEEATYVPHHKQKIAFLFSAMRHFAQELQEKGFKVDYVKLDDKSNSGSFTGEVERALERHKLTRIITTEPGEWRVLEMMRQWEGRFGLPVEMREDDRFFCSRGRFARWAEGRKSFRMEFFYREIRRESGLLMDGDEPVGGEWNFDKENRKSLPANERVMKRERFMPDAITRDVIALVEKRFASHFGSCENFGWAVTRKNALRALKHFIRDALPRFGDYQDAMKQGEPFLYHSIISPYLNCGLLEAHEVCIEAERAYQKGAAPLNAVEGFIRQVLGWREYVRGIYWLKMPHYATTNALNATRKLPPFFWSADTQMNCIKQVVKETGAHAYAHHIQRLMVTGNFALLAGIAPQEIEDWYLSVYADAFDWVELPNVHGMVMFADGGLLASKPYAASGAYINRMSDYCGHCYYKVAQKSGADACPFNILYWHFLMENEKQLARNPRMTMPYRNLKNMDDKRRKEIRREAEAFLSSIYEAPAKPTQTSLDL